MAKGSTDPYPATDLDILDHALETVSAMLDRVLAYVRSVLAGEVKGDAAVGRYLMNTFGASTEELEKGAFNTSLQVRRFDLSAGHMLRQVFVGYTHGLIPCQPRSVTSRSLCPSRTHQGRVNVQKAMYITFHGCISYIFPFPKPSKNLPVRWSPLTIENSRMLQVMASSKDFAQGPCHCWAVIHQDVLVEQA